MSNLQTYYPFKLDFQNVNQHAGGNIYKWYIMVFHHSIIQNLYL